MIGPLRSYPLPMSLRVTGDVVDTVRVLAPRANRIRPIAASAIPIGAQTTMLNGRRQTPPPAPRAKKVAQLEY